MIFKLIVTDQKDLLTSYLFLDPSITEAEDGIEAIVGPLNIAPNPTAIRIVLYNIQIENEGTDEKAFIDNITNPDYMYEIESWHVATLDDWQYDLTAYLDERDLFDNLPTLN